ncbi:MAG: hypothetical protein KDC98_00900 [Planctomycetes bacterium]|nr:hypothetical protein [Planctomycetota bacterium]
MAICVTMLLAISTATVSQTRLRRMTLEQNLAMIACRSTIESMRDVAFSTLPTLDGVGFDIPGVNGEPGALRALPGDADGLPGLITVAVESSSGGETLYRITLAVDWLGAAGEQHYDSISLMAERKA